MKTWIGLFLISLATLTYAADSTGTDISLHAYLETNNVPVNREVVYHVELSWRGDLHQYQIQNIGEPVLSNLKLRGSGSSNRFYVDEQGHPRSVKRITYYFTPQGLGMAYIDGVSVQYTASGSDQPETLFAQRLGVKITERVAEPGEGLPAGTLILIVVALLFVGIVIFFVLKYFKIRKAEQETPEEQLSPETLCLQDIEHILRSDQGDFNDKFIRLSRTLERFLSEKRNLAPGSGYELVKKDLESIGFKKDLLEKLERFYRQSELSKFAGEPISESDFHLFADTAELTVKAFETPEETNTKQ